MLPEGKHLKKYYLAEELKRAVHNPINTSFPIITEHENTYEGQLLVVTGIIGRVDRIYFDASIPAIRWEGHINDETMARNVWDGSVTEVSASILSYKAFHEIHGEVGIDLTFTELSLCKKGHADGNSIEVK